MCEPTKALAIFCMIITVSASEKITAHHPFPKTEFHELHLPAGDISPKESRLDSARFLPAARSSSSRCILSQRRHRPPCLSNTFSDQQWSWFCVLVLPLLLVWAFLLAVLRRVNRPCAINQVPHRIALQHCAARHRCALLRHCHLPYLQHRRTLAASHRIPSSVSTCRHFYPEQAFHRCR